MTFAIAITVGMLGVVAMVIGAFTYFLFRVATHQFDCVLKAQFARQRSAVGGGRAYARYGDRGIFGGDLLGRHADGQAVQDHADRYTGSGDHGLAVHPPRIGGDQPQLLTGHSPGLPCPEQNAKQVANSVRRAVTRLACFAPRRRSSCLRRLCRR